MAKLRKPGPWKGEIVEEGQKGGKRHFRNRLFRPKWEGNRRGDNTSPLSLEGRSRKTVREKARRWSYPPRKEIQGAEMSMTTNPKWSSLAKPIKVQRMRR